MTKEDKILLTHFITRTGMYIHPVDIHNIQSFIAGYETGRKGKCRFYELSKDVLSINYKMKCMSDGWLGQITRLSEKKNVSSIVTFKKIALETIALTGLDAECEKVLKSRTIELITRIDKAGQLWCNETWQDDWLSLVSTNKKWFRQLWSKEEWVIVKSIDSNVRTGNIFRSRKSKLATEAMLDLKNKFGRLNGIQIL